MSPPASRCRNALRLIIFINLPCFFLVAGMMWVSSRKAAETAASRAAYAPMDARVRDLIESESDIEKLRSIARIQNIGASGSMEALLHISRKSTTSLLPGLIIPMASIAVAALALQKSRRQRIVN